MAYTLNVEKQEDDDNDNVKSLMKELMKGVVAQMQEEADQKSFAESQSTLNDLLSQIQEDENDSEALKQEDDDNDDNLLALLQEDEEGGDDARGQEDSDIGDVLLQDDSDDDSAELQDNDDGDDAIEQGFLTSFLGKIRRFGGRVVKVCRKVNKYSRYLNCLPRMQAEMQKADDGDDDLAKDMLRRIANKQQDDGDDAEAQFFRRIFRRARRIFRRYVRKPRRFIRRVRRGVGRLIRGYRRIRQCVRRYG